LEIDVHFLSARNLLTDSADLISSKSDNSGSLRRYKEKEIIDIPNSSSSVLSSQQQRMIQLHHKYLRDYDFDVFLSLPNSMQKELINEATFHQNSNTQSSQHLSKPAGRLESTIKKR
jgi:hypothetical protein